MASLTNKNIILGVSGSIAAYKAPDIVRRLQDLGAEVRVIFPSMLMAILQVTKGRPVSMRLIKPRLSFLDSFSSKPVLTTIPASANIATPLPLTKGLGSSVAITTSFTLASIQY
jgi:phosphopantothenoylcysteine synthetase/decarboxylase